MKKICSLIIAIALSVTSVSGCRSNYSNIDQTSRQESFICKTNVTSLINENEELIDFNITDDRITLTKSISSKNAEIRSFDINSGKTKTIKLDYSKFKYDPGENIILSANDKYYYLLDNKRSSSLIYAINRENLEISCIDIPDKKIEKFFVSENDIFYILYTEYDIRKQHSYIEKYENFELTESYDLAEILSCGEMTYINDIYINKENEIYVIYSMSNSVNTAKINTSGEVIANAKVKGIFGNINHFSVSDKNDIFIVNYNDQNTTLLNLIDSNTCETTDFYEEITKGISILNRSFGFDYITKNKNVFTGVNAESGEHVDLLSNTVNDDVCTVFNNEILFFNTVFEHQNILVNADKETCNILEEFSIESKNDFSIISSSFKDVEHVYLCNRENEQFILFTDNNGKIKKEVPLCSNDEKRYHQIETDLNNLYIVSDYNSKITYQKFDNDMNLTDELSFDNQKGINRILCKEGILYSYNNDGILYEVNFSDKKLIEKDPDSEVYDVYSYFDKLLIQDITGNIYIYEDDKKTELFNVNEIVGVNNLSNIFFDQENVFYVLSYTDNMIYRVDRINSSDLNSNIINIACDIDSSEIKNLIKQFNSENDDVLIYLSDYSSDEKIERLNLDIVNGNVPDIIISDGRIDMSIFEDLDVLEDMTGLIMEDDTLNPDDYYLNIFKASSKSDRITQISPFFSVITGIGKSSVLGEKSGWDYSEYLKTVSKNTDKDIIYYGYNKTGIIYSDIMYILISDCIDFKNKKMNYDEKITDVLSSLKPYLKFEHNENADLDRNEIENDYDMRFINNKIILDVEEIRDINSIRRYKHAVINDDIILKGLPSEHGNGSFVNPVLKIAIMKSCSNKKTAWNFIKQFLSDEYQSEKAKSYLPVKKSIMEELYNNCESEKIFSGDIEYNVPALSQNEKNMIDEWIQSLNSSIITENKIYNIINNELELYINNQYDEKKTLNEIKRKIDMYLSEV